MIGGHLAAFLGSLAVAVYFLGTPFLVRRLAAKRTPWGVAARLDSPTRRLCVKVRTATWDPGEPVGARSGWLYGRGTATYTVGDDGMVHLRFERSDGRVIESSGPVPPRPATERQKAALYAPIAIMGVAAALCAAAGAAIDSSSRLVGAAWGLLVGIGVGWVAASIVGVFLRNRKSARAN